MKCIKCFCHLTAWIHKENVTETRIYHIWTQQGPMTHYPGARRDTLTLLRGRRKRKSSFVLFGFRCKKVDCIAVSERKSEGWFCFCLPIYHEHVRVMSKCFVVIRENLNKLYFFGTFRALWYLFMIYLDMTIVKCIWKYIGWLLGKKANCSF